MSGENRDRVPPTPEGGTPVPADPEEARKANRERVKAGQGQRPAPLNNPMDIDSQFGKLPQVSPAGSKKIINANRPK